MDRISIVTICFNNLSELLITLDSIDKQTQLPFEHIIVDGSTDKNIFNYLSTHLQPEYRNWKSEPDQGISDAFNKGIQKSQGEIIGILNSGDTLFDNHVLQKIGASFDSQPQANWAHGKLYTLRGDQWVTVGKPFDPQKLYRGMRGVFHPTMYLRRSVYDKIGGYDKSVKIAMDYDLLCRLVREPFIFIDSALATFNPDGVSTNNYLKALRESYQCYRKYFGYSLIQQIWYFRLAFLHRLLQSQFGKYLYRMKVKLKLENL